MRRLLILCLLIPVLGALPAAPPARAQADAPVVSGAFRLNGRAVALPAGEWRLLGRDVQPPQGSALGSESLLLVQEAPSRAQLV